MSQDTEYKELLNYAERKGIIDISRLKIDVEMSKVVKNCARLTAVSC